MKIRIKARSIYRGQYRYSKTMRYRIRAIFDKDDVPKLIKELSTLVDK